MKKTDPNKARVAHTNLLIKLTKTYAPESERKEKVNRLKELKKHYKGSKK